MKKLKIPNDVISRIAGGQVRITNHLASYENNPLYTASQAQAAAVRAVEVAVKWLQAALDKEEPVCCFGSPFSGKVTGLGSHGEHKGTVTLGSCGDWPPKPKTLRDLRIQAGFKDVSALGNLLGRIKGGRMVMLAAIEDGRVIPGKSLVRLLAAFYNKTEAEIEAAPRVPGTIEQPE